MKSGINQRGFELYLIQLIAETLLDENIPDKTRALRIEGYSRLKSILYQYKEMGFIDELIDAIAFKKSEMIKQTQSKTELEKILKPKCPKYNGAEFFPDEYNVPEEELIGWSVTSLSSPLNDVGQKRFMSLFKSIFPNVIVTGGNL